MLYLFVVVGLSSQFIIKPNLNISSNRLTSFRDILIDSARQNTILLFGRLANTKTPFCPEQLSHQEPYSHCILGEPSLESKDFIDRSGAKWTRLFDNPYEILDFDLFVNRLFLLPFYWPIYLDGTIVESGVYNTLVDTLFAKLPAFSLLENLTGQQSSQVHTRCTTRSAINKSLTHSPIPLEPARRLFNFVCNFGHDKKSFTKNNFLQFIYSLKPKTGNISYPVFESFISIKN